MNEPRRGKVFCIPIQMIEALAREGAMVRCMRGIPEGAKIVGVDYDVARDCFTVACMHPSFPPVDIHTIPTYEYVVLEPI